MIHLSIINDRTLQQLKQSVSAQIAHWPELLTGSTYTQDKAATMQALNDIDKEIKHRRNKQ